MRQAQELMADVSSEKVHPTLLGTASQAACGPSVPPPATRFQRQKPQLQIKTSLEGESFQMFKVKSSPHSPDQGEIREKSCHLLTPRAVPPRASSHDAKKTGKLPGLKTIDQDNSSRSPPIRRTSLTVQDDGRSDFSFPACHSIDASRPAQRTISRPRFCGRRFSTSS